VVFVFVVSFFDLAVQAVGPADVLLFYDGRRTARDLLRMSQDEVAPRLRPIVVLFGQHGPNEADQGLGVGKDPYYSVPRRIAL
jgi:hypothetical protein